MQTINSEIREHIRKKEGWTQLVYHVCLEGSKKQTESRESFQIISKVVY